MNEIQSTELSFATPVWLWGLALLLPAVLLRIWSSMEGRDSVSLLVSPKLREDLLFGTIGRSKASPWWRFSLLSAAFVCLVLALARPQWGEIAREEIGEGRSVMLAMDTSRSMLATDLKPDRLTRAKFAAHDLVDALPGDQIGLMAFAGTAFVQVPLTTDREALSDSIDQVDTYSISRGGTNLGAAIKLASSSFEEASTKQHALILFTDGEELEGTALDEAKKAAKTGTTIIAIGVGSAEGSEIPDPESRGRGGRPIMDKDGNVVRTKLDTAALEKIARATDGLFMHLDKSALNADLIRSALAKLDSTETDSGIRTVPIERFMWPLALGMLLMGIDSLIRLRGRRRAGAPTPVMGAVATALLFVLLFPPSAQGGAAADAFGHYQEENFEEAQASYEAAIEENTNKRRHYPLLMGLGASLLKQDDYRGAVDAFGTALLSNDLALQEDAHYNLGNTLYRGGESFLAPKEAETEGTSQAPAGPTAGEVKAALRDWYGAIDHYESALALNENNTQARENMEFVKERIKELEQQQEEQQQQQDQEQQDQEQEQQDQEQEQQDQEQEQQDQEQENQEENEQEQQQSGDEQQEQQPADSSDAGKPEPSQQEEGEEEASADGEESMEDGEGSEERQLEEAEEGEEEVNEETGYSVEEALRQLEAFAGDDEKLEQRKRRARARFFKDW